MRPTLSLLALIAIACTGSAPAVAEAAGRSSVGPYRVEVTDAWGNRLPTFWRQGRTWVLGEEGQRYRIRVHNDSGRRVEAVISVDGRDAIDGRPANWQRRGYVIGPWSQVSVDGFRLNLSEVATFRFSSVADSYAARMGNARNVGVIGVAVFGEQPPPPVYRPLRPWEYDEEARFDGDGPRGGGGRAPAKSQGPGASPAPEARDSVGSRARGESGALPRPWDRPGLGTEFGERRDSGVLEVPFRRARPGSPDAVLELRYNDEAGLTALGIDLRPRPWYPPETWRRETARPFENRGYASPPPGWEEWR
jgi:hypothetical protein